MAVYVNKVELLKRIVGMQDKIGIATVRHGVSMALMMLEGIEEKVVRPTPLTMNEALYAMQDVLLETRGNDDTLWCRCAYQDDGIVAVCTTVGNHYYRKSDYGRKWRCWQERTTDAERTAAEWEG